MIIFVTNRKGKPWIFLMFPLFLRSYDNLFLIFSHFKKDGKKENVGLWAHCKEDSCTWFFEDDFTWERKQPGKCSD